MKKTVLQIERDNFDEGFPFNITENVIGFKGKMIII